MSILFLLLTFGVFAWLCYDLISLYLPYLQQIHQACQRTSGPDCSEESELLLLPKALIILPLRGADPHLDDTLRRLLAQNYPNFQIRCVVDSPQDAALEQVQRALQEDASGRLSLQYRDCLLSTCSRKICSLLSVLNTVEPDVELVVFCDGDATPHVYWLHELANALTTSNLVATSGNRWYAAEQPTLATELRYYWNAMAVPRMYQTGIPWAGSLALSRSLFTNPDYLEAISRAFSEDTQTARFLFERGAMVRPQPTLPVINRESLSLRDFWGFLERQMLTVRLSHPQWPLVFCHACLLGFAVWILLPWALLSTSVHLAAWGIGVACFAATTTLLTWACDRLTCRLLRNIPGGDFPPYGAKRILLAAPAMVLLAISYPVVVLRTAFVRQHLWRGVMYRFRRQGIEAVPVDTISPQLLPHFPQLSENVVFKSDGSPL